jgi:predicted O-methyltransferase YrrM
MLVMDEMPVLVERACALARRVGFPLTRAEAEAIGPDVPSACLPGVGRFLAVLAAGCQGGRIGEIGTGVGIGTAWMAGAMPAGCSLVTVEIDEERAAVAAELLAGDSRVRVLTGDAGALIGRYAPFDLLFADGGWWDPASLVDLVRVGGRLVKDDVTPVPPGAPAPSGDAKRELFFGDPRLLSAEVVLPDLRNSLLVGTRLS